MLNLKKITYLNYTFQIYAAKESIPKIITASKILPLKEENKENEINLNYLYFINVPKQKTINDVIKYAELLCKTNPSSVTLENEENGVWLLKFNSNIGR